MAAKQGFLSTILNRDAVGPKVSVRHTQGGHSSEVVVKRGSTVFYMASMSVDIRRVCRKFNGSL